MQTMKLELRHALVVTSIAEAGSISAAATRLSVPQPSLTTQLRRIERVVGGKLFVRSSRGVTPTPLGERLIPMLVDILRRSEEVLLEARSSPAEALLVLGLVDSTLIGLGRALAGDAVPGEVRTISVDLRGAWDGVADGTLSAALVPHVDVDLSAAPETVTTPVSAEPVCLALPQDHPWSTAEHVDQRRLRSQSWVLRADDHWFRPIERWSLDGLGVRRPRVVHRAAGEAEALAWVAAGEAIALVSPLAQAAGVEIVPLPPTAPAVFVETVLLHQPSQVPDVLARRLVAGVRLHQATIALTRPRYQQWLQRHRAEGLGHGGRSPLRRGG